MAAALQLIASPQGQEQVRLGFSFLFFTIFRQGFAHISPACPPGCLCHLVYTAWTSATSCPQHCSWQDPEFLFLGPPEAPSCRLHVHSGWPVQHLGCPAGDSGAACLH